MTYRLSKLQSMLTMASLTSQTHILRQSYTAKTSHFKGHGRSIFPRRSIFQASSNPSIFPRCLHSASLPRHENRLRISNYPLNYPVFFSADTPEPDTKPSIDPNPSYPIPEESDTTPVSTEFDPLPPEVPAKPEFPPTSDPSWPSEVPNIDPSPLPGILPLGRETIVPTKPPLEVPLKTTDIRDPPMNPPGSPPPDIVPPFTPPGIAPNIPPNPPPNVPPNPLPNLPPFPYPTPPDPFPPTPAPPIMEDWPMPLQFPWMQILNINGFSINSLL